MSIFSSQPFSRKKDLFLACLKKFLVDFHRQLAVILIPGLATFAQKPRVPSSNLVIGHVQR